MDPAAHHRFTALVEPHLPAVRRYVERRDPGLADDVMQEVGVVAWRRLDDLPRGEERAWLFGVARNVLLAERRRQRRHDALRDHADGALDAVVAAQPGDEDAGLSALVAGPLAQALGRMNPRDRELLLLTAWEGLSTAEAAGVLGIRSTAARMGLVRARRRLAAALDELDPGWDGAGHAANDDPKEAIACRAART